MQRKEDSSPCCKEDLSLFCKEGFPIDYKDVFDHSRVCSLTVYLQKYHQKYNIRFMLQLFCTNDWLSNCVCAFEFFIQKELLNTGKEPANVFEECSLLSLAVHYRKYKFIQYLALYGVDMNRKHTYSTRLFNFTELEYLAVHSLFYKLFSDYYGPTENFIETYKTLCAHGCDDSKILGTLIRCTKAPYKHMKVHKFSLSKEINSKPISDFFMSMYREQLEEAGISD